MPLDSLTLAALCRELNDTLCSARIDRVQQPEKDAVLLTVRGRESGKLLLCARPGSTRVHLTGRSFENPAVPPMFCMLLRKHLTGARIVSFTQPELERVLDICLDSVDDLGFSSEKHVICELFGKSANIIVTDDQGVIIDCLRRVGDVGAKRPVLPGMLYRLPPSQDKPDPRGETEESFLSRLSQAEPQRETDRWLTGAYVGLSPVLGRELVFRATGKTDCTVAEVLAAEGGRSLFGELSNAVNMMESGGFQPMLALNEEGEPAEFSCMELTHLGENRAAESFSALLDDFWGRRDELESMRRRSSNLYHTAKNARDRAVRRLGLQRQELEDASHRDTLRQYGDFITANIWQLKKGMESFQTEDYYNGGTVTVKLDPRKTPQQNAAAYYKEYTRARTAHQVLTQRIARGEEELHYLESVLEALERASGQRDIDDIRYELTQAGYIKVQTGKKEKHRRREPLKVTLPSGLDVLVGRSNLENDELTTHVADRYDLWLHARQIHGAHVILRTGGTQPDEESILQAAQLAAYYSHGRQSGRVPVDVTQVRYVKKPSGARPGMVTYSGENTVLVQPKQEF